MLRLGVTGGIGVGKSTVCQIFSCLGVPIYDADQRAKALYSENLKLQKELIQKYGTAIYKNGAINTELLGKIIFTDKQELQWLNALVHPLIFEDYEHWCQQNEDAIYTIKEAAIMFESDSDKNVDAVIGVFSPEALRMERVMARDGSVEEEIRSRMSKQMPQEDLLGRCQFYIHNDSENSLISQVIGLHKTFIEPNFSL
ncbi:MAG: dephospho-CoA kinase [Bacteroidia bacterium]|nr:dephospho-CoA kinase [Bacteroidia bacterium]